VNTLVLIDAQKRTFYPLVAGADFYGGPKFSPDGSRIAWQEWYHPDMPWEGALVFIADLIISPDTVEIKHKTHVAGQKQTVSGAYPLWSSTDTLVFTSDESGYINPWTYSVSQGGASQALAKPVAQEFGAPMWALHFFPYALLDKEGRYALFVTLIDGRNTLQVVDLGQPSQPQVLDVPYVVIGFLRSVSLEDNEVVFKGEKVDEEPSIVKCRIQGLGSGNPTASFEVLKAASSPTIPNGKDYVSKPQPMTLKAKNGDPIHVVYYPPTNPQYWSSSSDGSLPPCVVGVHGGPTSLREQGLLWSIQYFTSRGFAWCVNFFLTYTADIRLTLFLRLDVNYGGSSGYGRDYINRLVGNWGIVDVSDCVEAAKIISGSEYKLADPKRLLIRGGSAGGYTVLAALACAPDVTTFAAGCSLYGISDLKPLMEHTHKFESHYLFKLIGGKYDEVPEVFKARSPIHHIDRIVSPLLVSRVAFSGPDFGRLNGYGRFYRERLTE
jgi:dipeptidyl aminopeptidase/acylaminoacyl peptidase